MNHLSEEERLQYVHSCKKHCSKTFCHIYSDILQRKQRRETKERVRQYSVCEEDKFKVKKRRKTRRGKRIRNEEERRRLINEYMKQRKHKVAPSNTTQFIIEDHEKVEPILFLSPRTSLSSPEAGENAEFEFSLSEEEDNFDEQYFLNDFEVTYRQLCRENLYTFSKNELLDKIKSLENRRDSLEKERLCFNAEKMLDNQENTNKLLNGEIKELQHQNVVLKQENEMLKSSKMEQNMAPTDC